jgi:hypothetical protein
VYENDWYINKKKNQDHEHNIYFPHSNRQTWDTKQNKKQNKKKQKQKQKTKNKIKKTKPLTC